MHIKHHTLKLETLKGISIFDITPQIHAYLQESNISQGFVKVSD